MSQQNIRAIPRGLGVADRRAKGRDKRQIPVAVERRSGKGRRNRLGQSESPFNPLTRCDHDSEEIAFMKAMDQYKRDNRRPFPTWSEVLDVLRALGYVKVVA